MHVSEEDQSEITGIFFPISELPLVALGIHMNSRCVLFNLILSMAHLKLIFQLDMEGNNDPTLQKTPTY